MSLQNFYDEFEQIVQSNQVFYEREQALAKLMVRMEYEYQIPIDHNEDWEKENSVVFTLYQLIEQTRYKWWDRI